MTMVLKACNMLTLEFGLGTKMENGGNAKTKKSLKL